MTEVCVYCGNEHGDGYCLDSPDGYCKMEDDPDYVRASDCCPECGIEMDVCELEGVVEHVCDAQRKAEYQEWLHSDPDEWPEGFDLDWDYREGRVVKVVEE